MSEQSRTHEDAYNLLCGQLLGTGIHRQVFECRLDPTLVVKVEIPTDWRYFANVHEMKFWSDHGHKPKIGKWLAPCTNLSPDGRILLQKRVKPVEQSELPELMPDFLSDFKAANYGLLNGQLVCVDYAIVHLRPSVRLTKANWG